MNSKSVWQRLYDSEINFSISTFWDGGFDWKLGDSLNGIKATGCSSTFAEAEREIEAAALKHFPKSVFATDAEALNPTEANDE